MGNIDFEAFKKLFCPSMIIVTMNHRSMIIDGQNNTRRFGPDRTYHDNTGVLCDLSEFMVVIKTV